jgi:hypothetical protein
VSPTAEINSVPNSCNQQCPQQCLQQSPKDGQHRQSTGQSTPAKSQPKPPRPKSPIPKAPAEPPAERQAASTVLLVERKRCRPCPTVPRQCNNKITVSQAVQCLKTVNSVPNSNSPQHRPKAPAKTTPAKSTVPKLQQSTGQNHTGKALAKTTPSQKHHPKSFSRAAEIPAAPNSSPCGTQTSWPPWYRALPCRTRP